MKNKVVSLATEMKLLQNKQADLQARIEAEQNKQKDKENAEQLALTNKINSLPKMFELSSIDDVIALLEKSKAPKVNIRYRGRKGKNIPDEIKTAVVQAVKNGVTGAEIAKEYKISLPSVQNIKAAFGLVKKRAIAA